MAPALVGLGIAAVFGCLLLGVLRLRLLAAGRQPEVTEDDLCSLRQADRITSRAVAASVIVLIVVGLAHLIR